MNILRSLYHLALADFFERVRRYRFLLILAAIIYMGVLVNNDTLALYLGPGDHHPLSPFYRGEFNSAWIGTMTVLVTNLFLGLFSFYLVNDCIERDIRTGVGQIIATTPVSRAAYLVGKWISNCLVLFLLVLILAAAAAIMVLLKGEAALDPGVLLMPFFAVALPYMALVAALAVAFETVPWLRGAVGNAGYVFLWMFTLMCVFWWRLELPGLKDPVGINVFSESLQAGARAAFPNDAVGGLMVGNNSEAPLKAFNWSGLDWTPSVVGMRWSWAVLGLGLVLLSAVWFGRFDPAREGQRHVRAKPEESKEGEAAAPSAAPLKRPFRTVLLDLFMKVSKLSQLFDLSPLVSKLAQVNPFLGVLFAELRLLLNGRRWWWWLVIAGLNFAILMNSLETIKGYLLPIAWLWPLAIWSGMGNREKKNSTYQMVYSSARPVLRQLPSAWLAGVLATALLGIAGAVVFLSNGDLPGLAGWAGAVIFIPTLALALGVFSSGSRAFEVIYVIWWYLGPMQKIPGMDFINGQPQFYLLASAGLLLLAVFWRGRQVRA